MNFDEGTFYFKDVGARLIHKVDDGVIFSRVRGEWVRVGDWHEYLHDLKYFIEKKQFVKLTEKQAFVELL